MIAVWKELGGRGWGWTWEEFVAFIEEHRQWKKEEHDLLVPTCNDIMAEKAAERMRKIAYMEEHEAQLTPTQRKVLKRLKEEVEAGGKIDWGTVEKILQDARYDRSATTRATLSTGSRRGWRSTPRLASTRRRARKSGSTTARDAQVPLRRIPWATPATSRTNPPRSA